MLKCYEAYCKIAELYENGSTGGVASGLAYYLLQKKIVDGILVSKRYDTFIACSIEDLLKSQGSIYENFSYLLPSSFSFRKMAQIGKPCDLHCTFKVKISLFCSSLFSNIKNPINKQELRAKSRVARYLRALIMKPMKCRVCEDHIGKYAHFSVGDSQYDQKLNHVLVRSHYALQIWLNAISDNFIWAREIKFEDVKRNQPYLFGEISLPRKRVKP